MFLAEKFTLQDFLVALVITVIFIIVIVIYEYMKYKSGSHQSITASILPLKEKYRRHLENYFLFYKKLPSRQKSKFEKRVQHFINIKQFHARGFDKVSDEMKALIAASAIQITFGLPGIFFSHFKNILIYPDKYFSTINQQHHKGEVNPRHGVIVLSWQAFVEGYVDHQDSINLGLHEMAHALRLENGIVNNEYRFLNEDLLEAWKIEAAREVEKNKAGDNTIFRSYAFTNEHEFFAVAVENFFERPGLFADYNPRMYNAMAKLLNQDPLENYSEL